MGQCSENSSVLGTSKLCHELVCDKLFRINYSKTVHVEIGEQDKWIGSDWKNQSNF